MKKLPVMMINRTGIVSSNRRAMNLNMVDIPWLPNRVPRRFPYRVTSGVPFLEPFDADSSR